MLNYLLAIIVATLLPAGAASTARFAIGDYHDRGRYPFIDDVEKTGDYFVGAGVDRP